MKKEEIIIAVILYFFVVLRPGTAEENNYISGKITDIEGEYIYVEFDKIQNIENGMIFGIYDLDKKPVAVCEITKFRVKNNFVAFILIQVEDVKKGYNVFSSKEEESKLRGKIKKDKGTYYDFFKDFAASHSKTDVKQEAAEEFLSYQILIEAIAFLKLDINWFKKYDVKSREKIFLNTEEKQILDVYRDIISEGSVFENIDDQVSAKAKINLGKLKYRLVQQGYSLKPKIIRLVFSSKTLGDDIKTARDTILENSIYVSTEEINSKDITSPISFIIYTTPEIFAEEIEAMEMDGQDIYFTIYEVEGDTIEMDASRK